VLLQEHSGALRSKEHAMSEDQFETWQQRLESAVAAYTLRKTKRNRERRELAERRAYGLMARHAAKEARLRRPPDKP
jgi:hypothetical protein